MKTVSVIIPTTGSDDVVQAIQSCLNQTYECDIVLVVDGNKFKDKIDKLLEYNSLKNERLKVYQLCDNVGANGFYGHRIYAAFSHLINSDYLMYLDQDCWYDENHIESMINCIESKNLDWCYSLRKIVSKDGKFICNDDCESLGKYNPIFDYNLCDTNTYCIKTSIASKISPYIHGGWGFDRVYYSVLSQNFKNFDCSGKYTVNYRLDGNENSVKKEFFIQGNDIVNKKFGNNFPWSSS